MTVWMLCMGVLLATAAAPLMIPSCYDKGYPLPLRIAVGIGLVALAWTFPPTSQWMVGLVMIGLAGVAPIVVDGLLDRAPAGSPAPSGAGSFDHDGGMTATCAALPATAAIGSF